jgi:hypothetical protein
MAINLNFFGKKTAKNIITLLQQQELNIMATLQDIKDAVAGITDAVAAQQASFDLLITEVRQLIAQGDITGADELLAEMAADRQAIIDAAAANANLTAEVDSANGDPLIDA